MLYEVGLMGRQPGKMKLRTTGIALLLIGLFTATEAFASGDDLARLR